MKYFAIDLAVEEPLCNRIEKTCFLGFTFLLLDQLPTAFAQLFFVR